MPTCSARWGTSTCRSPSPATCSAKRPCRASCSRRWSRKPCPVDAAGAVEAGGASRSRETLTRVSLVVLSTSARLATGRLHREHAFQRREERVVLAGQAHRHAQAAAEAGQVVLAPHDDAPLQEAGVHALRV